MVSSIDMHTHTEESSAEIQNTFPSPPPPLPSSSTPTSLHTVQEGTELDLRGRDRRGEDGTLRSNRYYGLSTLERRVKP